MKEYIKFTPEQLIMLLRLISIQAKKQIDDEIDTIPVFDSLIDENFDIGASKTFIIRSVTKGSL